MGFDKNYENRKDWRKQYQDSRRFDPSCRNHGSCGHCGPNRCKTLRKSRKNKNRIDE